jgi:hypothetical protein
MRFVIVFMLAAAADFLWAGYISAVSGKQAVRAAGWSMAIAVVSGVIAIHYVQAPVLLVSLASGSFVGTYLSVVSENGKAIRHRLVLREIGLVSGLPKSNQPNSEPVGVEDITHQTWTGTTRRTRKTGVFNGRRELGE